MEDSALLLSIIAGEDPRDRHSLPGAGIDYRQAIQQEIRGLLIAYSPDWGYAAVDPEVRTITEQAARVFADELGCYVEEASPGLPETAAAYMATVARDTDLWSLRQWQERWPQAMSRPLAEILETDWTAEDLTNAAMVRQQLSNTMRSFMESYALLLTPTMPCPPFPIGQEAPEQIGPKVDVTTPDLRAFTSPLNLTGQPAATLPVGFTQSGLPVGLQVIGRPLDDLTVLAASAAFERARPWRDRWPPLVG